MSPSDDRSRPARPVPRQSPPSRPHASASYLQVHPSRWCQLRCRHCYTSSGPDDRSALSPEVLAGAVRDAARLGYGQLDVSGGEPLLYDGLEPLLRAAREEGMATGLVTNGLALTPARAATLRVLADLVAVSFDGTAASHDRMRGLPGSFETARRRLRLLREAGVPFAVITTLTQHNVHELPELARLAAAEGALALQVHPLDVTGRAEREMAASGPDQRELAVAALTAAALATTAVPVTVDVVYREQLRSFPGRFCADGTVGSAWLGEWLPVLVVEPDGWVVPAAYGTDRRWALGSLHDAPLGELARAWRSDVAPSFVAAMAEAHERVVRDGPEVMLWGAELARALREVVRGGEHDRIPDSVTDVTPLVARRAVAAS